MPRPGWIKLYYSLLDNPMWTQKPFTEGQAWVDLLLLASHEEHDVRTKSGIDTWEPGTVHLSRGFFMDRWGWSKRKVDSTLKRWQEQNMIERPAFGTGFGTGFAKPITVVKWGFFQGNKRKSGTGSGTGFGTQHKKYIKKGGDGGSTPRPAGEEFEVVKINGEWVARPK